MKRTTNAKVVVLSGLKGPGNEVTHVNIGLDPSRFDCKSRSSSMKMPNSVHVVNVKNVFKKSYHQKLQIMALRIAGIDRGFFGTILPLVHSATLVLNVCLFQPSIVCILS